MLSEEVPHLQASFDPTVVFGGVTQYIVWMVICWIITLVLILVVGRKLTLIPTNKPKEPDMTLLIGKFKQALNRLLETVLNLSCADLG